MKKTLLISASLLLLFVTFIPNAKAQEEENPWGAGLDIYSSYIWRGAKFGSGPAFQPYVSFATGGFEIGGWGSISASTDEALEMDLYAGYSFALGENSSLGITVTDYYFGGDWTDFSANHFFEPSISLGLGDFSLMGAYMIFSEGDDNGDMYLEAAYSFENFSIGLGAGDGQYTMHEDDDGEIKDDFGICNINIGTSKEIPITESFSLPVSGAIILNPATGGFFITVGISL